MPISVTCTKCGKMLKVKDEYVGRRMKCPQCGTTFTATAGGGAPVGGAVGGGGAMGAPSIAKQKSQSAGPAFHLSPGIIIFIIAFVGIGGTILLWKIGPGKVKAQWDAMEPKAKDEIIDVVDRGLQSDLANEGLYDPSVAHATPHVMDVTFLASPMNLTMPDWIGFFGVCSTGKFHGKYHPKTGEIEADVDTDGMALPSGVIMRQGKTQIHVTGHSRDGKIECLVNGKTATVNLGDGSRHGI